MGYGDSDSGCHGSRDDWSDHPSHIDQVLEPIIDSCNELVVDPPEEAVLGLVRVLYHVVGDAAGEACPYIVAVLAPSRLGEIVREPIILDYVYLRLVEAGIDVADAHLLVDYELLAGIEVAVDVEAA